MDIQQTETKTTTVHLNEESVHTVTVRNLLRLLDGGEYLCEEKRGRGRTVQVLKMDDPDHRHGSIAEIKVRDATELDLAVFKVLDALRERREKAKGVT